MFWNLLMQESEYLKIGSVWRGTGHVWSLARTWSGFNGLSPMHSFDVSNVFIALDLTHGYTILVAKTCQHAEFT